jgi:hypothetical protein
MIQVSCIYCGKKLAAKEEWVGKRVMCPACKHIFFIPDEATLRDESKTNENKKRKAAYWAGKNDAEISDALLNGFTTEAPQSDKQHPKNDSRAEVIKKRKEEYWSSKSSDEIVHMLLESEEEAEATRPFFLPRYDDLTLFTLSVTLLLLAITNRQLQDAIKSFFASGYHFAGFYVLLALFSLGLLPSLANVFLRRQKSNFEKVFMLLFAVGATAGAGIYAGVKMFESFRGWLLIFPIWNIITGVILLLYFPAGIVTTKCITDESSSFLQLAISVAATALLLVLCNYVFKLHWVYTYSIAVCYTTSLHNVVQDFFGKAVKN